jgi:hypothetical protein
VRNALPTPASREGIDPTAVYVMSTHSWTAPAWTATAIVNAPDSRVRSCLLSYTELDNFGDYPHEFCENSFPVPVIIALTP